MARLIYIFFTILLLLAPMQVFAKSITVGLLLAGKHNDQSYNQFHLDAALAAAKAVGGVKVIYIESANPIVRSGVSIPDMVDDLVQKGATLIVANSFEMELGITATASNYPTVTFVQINGEEALSKQATPNIMNISLMPEYAQMLSGFASGMASPGGKIAYLAASPNAESYRKANAAYLAAKHAWENVRQMPAKDFRFRIKWMGNWFHNLSPHEDTRLAAINLFNAGFDVIIGANDDIALINAAAEVAATGRQMLITVSAEPYIAQNTAPYLLGLEYYNWLTIYEELFINAKNGNLYSTWLKIPPDFARMDRPMGTNVGFAPYDGLSLEAKLDLRAFIRALALQKIDLFDGPLIYKDGRNNVHQLLEGIEEEPLTLNPTH